MNRSNETSIYLLKSFIHNVGVLIVGFVVALSGVLIDSVLHVGEIRSLPAIVAGILLLAVGFSLRTWATFYFYQRHMNVIVLHAQQTLITGGPYRFSRNPLYLGGNVFVFLGPLLY